MSLIKALTILKSNPEKVFVNTKGEHLWVQPDGDLYFEGDYLSLEERWEEAEKPVTWQEAIEAWVNGKGNMVEMEDMDPIFSYNDDVLINPASNKLGCFINNETKGFNRILFEQGTWYIIDK